jgi:hypothetical protein
VRSAVASRVPTPVLAQPLFGFEVVDVECLLGLVAAKEVVEMRDAVCRIDTGDLDRLVGLGIVVVDRDGEPLDVLMLGAPLTDSEYSRPACVPSL